MAFKNCGVKCLMSKKYNGNVKYSLFMKRWIMIKRVLPTYMLRFIQLSDTNSLR